MSSNGNFIGGDQVTAYMIVRDESGNPIWWDGQITVEVTTVTMKPIDSSNRVHERGNKGSGLGDICSYTVPEGKVFQFQGVVLNGDVGIVLLQVNSVTIFSMDNSNMNPQLGFLYPDNNPADFPAGTVLTLYKNTTNGTIYGEIFGFLEDV